jgi:glycosyltransferase involved in cell wall biosynthesis
VNRTAGFYTTGRRGAAQIRRLLAAFTPRRAVTMSRLVWRRDFEELRYRAGHLARAGTEPGWASEVRPPVVVDAEPWPVDEPLVSVVTSLPDEARVEDTIGAILRQTASHLCEVLVIVGDADDPAALERVTRIADDPTTRVRLLRRDGEHIDPGGVRAFGIDHARGRYVLCIDGNEAMDPRLVEVASYLLERRGHDAVSTSSVTVFRRDHRSAAVRADRARRSSLLSSPTPFLVAPSPQPRGFDVVAEGAFANLRGTASGRPTVLIALPFMLIGGAERLLSAVARYLVDNGYRVVVMTSVRRDPRFGDSSAWFEAATTEVYDLPELLTDDYWVDFADYIVDTKDVDAILIAGSTFAYHQLPRLRNRYPDLRVADILFNTEVHAESNRAYADHIDLHLCEAPSVRDWLLARGEDEDSIEVIESGIDVSAYRPAERRRGLPLRVGFSGRLSDEKAPLAFLDLARELSDSRFEFSMTGAGPLEAAVLRSAADLPPGVFRFLGIVDDIRAHIASLDVLVLPSVVDGRPVVVLEAFALGVPVIASGVGGLPELVDEGNTGFLVDPGDTGAIARHLVRLANDPAELERLQQSARAYAVRHFDAAAMLASYEGALRRLTARRSAADPDLDAA